MALEVMRVHRFQNLVWQSKCLHYSAPKQYQRQWDKVDNSRYLKSDSFHLFFVIFITKLGSWKTSS